MISSTLTGRYFVGIQNGTLFVDFDTDTPELWLRTLRGEFKLLPCVEEESQQQSLPLEYNFNVDQMAFSYKPIFNKTINVLGHFSTEKQSIITFCLRYGEAALELIDDSPGLAFLIASRNFYQYDKAGDETCISPAKKSANILHQFGYPNTRSVSKIFKKIPADECSHEFFHDFKLLFDSNSSKVVKAMRHVKRLNHLTVKILTIVELQL